MKNGFNATFLLCGILTATTFGSCKKNSGTAKEFNLKQVNLVADVASLGAAKIDSGLRNAWGIAVNPTGIIWISSNHAALSTVYDSNGQTLRPPVTIPSAASEPGAPTGIVFNNTQGFGAGKFIFAGEDGIISSWVGGNAATKVADRSQAGAVYKGLALATDGASNFLYAANFTGKSIDVFDNNFNYVAGKQFADPAIPADFGPFNIKNIGGQLYVTFAKLMGPDNEDDQAGPGNGYVDIFNPNGTLVKHFSSKGVLNSPWGIAPAPAGFAADQPTILIGNFGDGAINIFDMSGNYIGPLQNKEKPVAIDGLWAIDFLKNNASGGTANDKLYFTAGPMAESHGLFGYLQKQ